LLPAIE